MKQCMQVFTYCLAYNQHSINGYYYATINYVDSEIAKIELKEGPQDTKEDPGTIDITTQFSDLLTIDKTIIGAINENTDKINILSDLSQGFLLHAVKSILIKPLDVKDTDIAHL